ncbi:MAG: CRTAC1 family protein [Phycisphaerales bacterium]|nr:CRTAC1 family protein [Phycisphaerales bacterium]
MNVRSSLSLRAHTRVQALALLAAAGLCSAAVAQVSVGGIQFVDRAAAGQITFGNIRGSFGVIDFDRDGFYDLFIADGPGLPNRLFRNVPSAAVPGGRTFQDVSASSGVNDLDGTNRGFGGVVVFDFNNDGWDDIYQVGVGPGSTSGVLYRNNANGTFSNVSIASNARQGDTNPLCASAADFDHDGWADLLIVSSGLGGNKALLLLKNNGDGTFTQRKNLLPVNDFSGTTYAHAWVDYDHDGWEDALVPLNNTVPLTLKNVSDGNGGRRFIDATQESGFTFVGPAPMGIAIGDYDRDGNFDLSITDAVVGTYYRGNNNGFQQTTPFTTFFGWGTTWLDADNDTNLDNYQAGSAGRANVDFIQKNNGRNANGQITWTDARSALNITARPTQYSAKFDFDNDGFEDIAAVNVGQFVSLYHNRSGTLPGAGHWAKVRLRVNDNTSGVNRSAIGAVVRLTSNGVTQVRQNIAGSSYSATEDPRLHFGLGASTAIDRIEVLWPRRGSVASRTQVFTGPFAADTIIDLSPNALCLADLDADRAVDDADFVLFAASYNLLLCSDTGQPADCPADLNSDGVVNDADFIRFAQAYSGLVCP